MSLPVSRQRLIAIARSLRVLPLVEHLHARRHVREAAEANAAWAAERPGRAFPPAELIRRTYGDASFRMFEIWGRLNAEDIVAVVERHTDKAALSVAEWGSGLGRISVHLPSHWTFTGFDIDRSSVDWCREHLGGDYRLNRPAPPLPAEDASFDVVYAVSIFTHLSQQAHLAWRDEILRVLKPGGVFIFTVHGEDQAGNLLPEERRRFDAGAIVVRGAVPEGSRTYLAYHPRRFVEDVLLAPFEKAEGPTPACGQTLYVGRKPV